MKTVIKLWLETAIKAFGVSCRQGNSEQVVATFQGMACGNVCISYPINSEKKKKINLWSIQSAFSSDIVSQWAFSRPELWQNWTVSEIAVEKWGIKIKLNQMKTLHRFSGFISDICHLHDATYLALQQICMWSVTLCSPFSKVPSPVCCDFQHWRLLTAGVIRSWIFNVLCPTCY